MALTDLRAILEAAERGGSWDIYDDRLNLVWTAELVSAAPGPDDQRELLLTDDGAAFLADLRAADNAAQLTRERDEARRAAVAMTRELAKHECVPVREECPYLRPKGASKARDICAVCPYPRRKDSNRAADERRWLTWAYTKAGGEVPGEKAAAATDQKGAEQ